MANLLPSLIDNLDEGLYKGKSWNCKSSLNCAKFKENTLILKCLDFKKNYEVEFYEGPTKQFQNTHRYFHGDIDKFCLIWQKGVYRYQ